MSLPEDCVIVDDFYRDPGAIRGWALKQAFSNVGKYSFPGWQGEYVVESPAIVSKMEEALGFPFIIDRQKYTFGGIRLITGFSGKHTKVHSDSVSEWAAMVYLTPDADLSSGTGFFRHKATGLSGPPDIRTALELGYSTPNSFMEDVIYKDAGNLDAWELTGEVQPVYNRLVAFRGARYYHAPLGGGGTEPESARMTHMFFFDEGRLQLPPAASVHQSTFAE
ncbi:hypothetical protein G3N30_14965 [Microbacterium lacticum]|uniref:DUF6445 family protein n=1 Tax=Microbacterium lacticum TaxID=33885 RepID=UPI0018B0840D|nr:DUF6445 family protein [Microbacterium lacticum]MBF9337461.1 hypothetical protein [Microbacterium lacticum]